MKDNKNVKDLQQKLLDFCPEIKKIYLFHFIVN